VIAAEGYVRNLPAFSNFLNSASLSDGEMVNFSTIARDCGVSSPVVKEYFQILVDTLLGNFLPAHVRRPKRRVIQAPKFYFFDVGIVNMLAKRGTLNPGGELFGKAFENWLFHELCAYREYSEKFYDLSYWRLTTGAEVDFIINDMEYAIEAKATANITSDHLHGLRQLAQDHPKVKRRIIVSLDKRPRKTEDGIEILPYGEFIELLWSGNSF
jgi:predicted AAA+ superfamily ATPase